MAPKSNNKRRQPAPRHRPRSVGAVRRQRQQERRRKIFVTVGAGALILAIVLALTFTGALSSDPATTTTSSSTSTSTPMKSVKGKPCVATKGPLPTGAPEVPVEVGKPPTKLVSKDLKVGDGAVVTKDSTITADYIGVACSTGKIFGSSYTDGSPLTSALSGLIPGWQQGIPGMKVGGQRLLGIPSDIAYGKEGRPPDIAPDEALWFVLTIKSVK